jgi:hypothetical protein
MQSTEGPARVAEPLGVAQRSARGLLWAAGSGRFLGAIFEAPAFVSGLDDIAVMGEPRLILCASSARAPWVDNTTRLRIATRSFFC